MADRSPAAKSEASTEEVPLGHVVGIFGVTGEVRLHLYNRESDLLRVSRLVSLTSPQGERREAKVIARSGAGGRVLCRIDGVTDRDAAAALRDWKIAIHPSQLPPPPPGEYYHRDLIGLAVTTASGQALGRVTEIQDAGEVDVWVVHDGVEERFIPAIAAYVLKVDVPAGQVTVADRCASTS